MNPFKNISVMRDQEDQVKEPTEFPEKREYDPAFQLLQQENDRLQHLTTVLIQYKELYEGLKGNTDYAKSQLDEILLLKKNLELLQQENDRLQHLTTVLIDHIWKKQPFPLKEIDQQMALFDKEQMDERSQQRSQFDDGGMDGIQRNK